MSTPIFDRLCRERPEVQLPTAEPPARHAAEREDTRPIQPPPEEHGRAGGRDE